jgi:Icc-related predicted phosphoesterase
MWIPDFIKKGLARDFAAAYRLVCEGEYKPGFPDETSTELQRFSRLDIKDSPIRLVHISDLHIGNHSQRKLQDLKQTLASLQPHFLVISGDIVHFPERKHLQEAKGVLQGLAGTSKEVLVVPGNHDRHGELDLNNWANEVDSGASPLFQCRMYELSDQRFVFFFLLNSTIAKTDGFVDQTVQDLVQVRGWIDDAQVSWLRKMHATIQDHHKTEYARGLKVAALHHHPIPVGDEGYLTEAFMSLGNSNRVLSILADMKIDLVLHGHKHVPAVRLLDQADRGHRLVILSAGTATSHIGKGGAMAKRRSRPGRPPAPRPQGPAKKKLWMRKTPRQFLVNADSSSSMFIPSQSLWTNAVMSTRFHCRKSMFRFAISALCARSESFRN